MSLQHSSIEAADSRTRTSSSITSTRRLSTKASIPHRIVGIDPVFQAFRKQRRLPAIDHLDEAPYPIPPQIAAAESYSANK
jgi:hypothetical protein